MIRGTCTDCIFPPVLIFEKRLMNITTTSNNTIMMKPAIAMVEVVVTLIAGVLVVGVVVVTAVVVGVVVVTVVVVVDVVVIVVLVTVVVVVDVHAVNDIDPEEPVNMLSFFAFEYTQETPQSI